MDTNRHRLRSGRRSSLTLCEIETSDKSRRPPNRLARPQSAGVGARESGSGHRLPAEPGSPAGFVPLGGRDTLVTGLNRVGWEVESPKGTMFLWAKIPEEYRKMGSVEFSKLLINGAANSSFLFPSMFTISGLATGFAFV